MLIRERELELLSVINESPNVTPVALIQKLKGQMSKALVYELIAALLARELVDTEIRGGDGNGPAYRIYNINRRGKRVNKAWKEMQEVLDETKVPGLMTAAE